MHFYFLYNTPGTWVVEAKRVRALLSLLLRFKLYYILTSSIGTILAS